MEFAKLAGSDFLGIAFGIGALALALSLGVSEVTYDTIRCIPCGAGAGGDSVVTWLRGRRASGLVVPFAAAWYPSVATFSRLR